MNLTAFSSIIVSLIVLIASTAVSVTVTASEQQQLLRDGDFNDAEDAIRSIPVDASVSAPGIVGISQSRELGIDEKDGVEKNYLIQDTRKLSQNSLESYDDYCTDDESFRYEYVNKKGKSKLKGGCTDFVGRKKKKRCRKRTIDGRKIRNICPFTCGFCEKKKKKVCSVERFIGVWQYLSSCTGGGLFELTIGCDDDGLVCSVQDQKIAKTTNADEDDNGGDDVELIYLDDDDADSCTAKGSFDPSDQIVNVRNQHDEYDCELPFVPLDGGTCEGADDEGPFGVKATLKSSSKEDHATVMFSTDGGKMFYNQADPYKALLVSDIDDNNGESKNANNGRRLKLLLDHRKLRQGYGPPGGVNRPSCCRDEEGWCGETGYANFCPMCLEVHSKCCKSSGPKPIPDWVEPYKYSRTDRTHWKFWNVNHPDYPVFQIEYKNLGGTVVYDGEPGTEHGGTYGVPYCPPCRDFNYPSMSEAAPTPVPTCLDDMYNSPDEWIPWKDRCQCVNAHTQAEKPYCCYSKNQHKKTCQAPDVKPWSF